MGINQIRTDFPYNVRLKLELLTSGYEPFSRDDSSEIVEICGHRLKLNYHALTFSFAVQF